MSDTNEPGYYGPEDCGPVFSGSTAVAAERRVTELEAEVTRLRERIRVDQANRAKQICDHCHEVVALNGDGKCPNCATPWEPPNIFTVSETHGDLAEEMHAISEACASAWDEADAAANQSIADVLKLASDMLATGAKKITQSNADIEYLRADVAELEDCRERLRDLGSYCGCDHVESADERYAQARHIREAFAKLRADRDAMAHVIVEAGVVPGENDGCRCEECRTVARKMAEAGYLERVADRWWEEQKVQTFPANGA